MVAAFSGCRRHSVPPSDEMPSPPPEVLPITSVAPDPYSILDQMVMAYQAAISYSDRATVQIIGKMSQPDIESVPWNCTVVFQKPNKIRLEIYEGILVSDGEDCYAQIRLLPDQVLHRSAPEYWTLATLFQDVHLDNAMEPGLPLTVFRFSPQLILLFANNPLKTFCPKGAKIEWLYQQHLSKIPCDVIRISHSDGNRILWISQENQALLRLDYQPVGLPVPEYFESIEAIRIEMTDAKFDWNFVPETFQMLQPKHAVQVAAFHSDTPGLLTQEEHNRQLQLMTDSDSYRLIEQQIESTISPEQSPLAKIDPTTFTLSQVWTVPLNGANTMTFLPDEIPKLLVPYEGNVVAVLDLKGNVLQRISPVELKDMIIMNIQSNSHSGTRRVGILTLDNKFYLFDESFKPLAVHTIESDKDKAGTMRDFCFFSYTEYAEQEDELLLLGILPDSGQENTVAHSVILAVDLHGTTRWEYPFEGIPNQISSAFMENQRCVLVSCTASHDSILVLSSEGVASDPVEIRFGRYVTWFHVVDATIYTLWENTDTGDVRFLGLDRQGKSMWSRLLPSGEYRTDPVYVPNEKKWFVPLPNGEILVFDLIGNKIDSFSLNIVPTKLFCIEIEGDTLLLVADGERVSAWKIGK